MGFATETLETAATVGFNSASHWYSLGAAWYREKAYAKALAALESCLKADPDHADGQRSIAATLEQLGRADQAVPHLRRYLELRPNSPDSDKIQARLQDADGG